MTTTCPVNLLAFFFHLMRQSNFFHNIKVKQFPHKQQKQWSSLHFTLFHGHTTSLLISSFHIIIFHKTMFTGLKPLTHIFSADIPGVSKEELRVEVEDSKYLIIRTEAVGESMEPARKFTRKFRLPGRIDLGSISAGCEDGVLTVTVPRSLRRGLYIDPADVPERLEVLARAA